MTAAERDQATLVDLTHLGPGPDVGMDVYRRSVTEVAFGGSRDGRR